jgi:hypothetical protein
MPVFQTVPNVLRLEEALASLTALVDVVDAVHEFEFARFRSKEIVPEVVTGFVPPRVSVELGVLAVTEVTVPEPPIGKPSEEVAVSS